MIQIQTLRVAAISDFILLIAWLCNIQLTKNEHKQIEGKDERKKKRSFRQELRAFQKFGRHF